MTPADPQRFLTTDAAAGELRRRSVRGGVATLAVQAAQFVVNIASTAILARLLVPEDFGLLAMAVAAANFLMLFRDLGLGAATVQRADITHPQVSGLFWINTGLGFLVALIMAAAAPAIAWFYGESRLLGVSIALAGGFVLGGVAVQHAALLRRQLRFTALAAIEMASLGLAAIAAIGAAWSGAGYWALVIMQLTRHFVFAAGVWSACGWRPSRPAGGVELRRLLAFGGGVTGFNLLGYLSRNADDVIVGRTAGAAVLGLYSKAYALYLLPVDRVRGPAAGVVVPALSRLQDDAERFRRYYLAAILLVTSLGMPIVAFLFVFAEEAVLLVLGGQWEGTVVLFRILAPAAFLSTFNVVGSWACIPFGRTRRLLRWQLFATGVTVAAFLVGARWGALGVAAALSLSMLLLRGPAVTLLLRDSPVRPADVWRTVGRPAFASVVAAAIVAALSAVVFLGVSDAVLLAATLPLFAGLYAAAWWMLPGGRRAAVEFRRLFADLAPGPRS